MNLCDLHTHSNYSDGSLSPSELINAAIVAGICAVALTDHNTVAGLPEFLAYAQDKSIHAIAGIEISSDYEDRELHIIGLDIPSSLFGQVTDFVSAMNRRKEDSNLQLVERLRQSGYDLSYEEITSRYSGNINRANIASVLVEKGYIATVREGMNGILSVRSGYYTPPSRIPSLDAIAFLAEIGAVPVLAHPYLNLKDDDLRNFLPKAKGCGLAAMETMYSLYSPETTAAAKRIAREFDLLESGGSDFHGRNKPTIQIGRGKGNLTIPFCVAEKLLNR